MRSFIYSDLRCCTPKVSDRIVILDVHYAVFRPTPRQSLGGVPLPNLGAFSSKDGARNRRYPGRPTRARRILFCFFLSVSMSGFSRRPQAERMATPFFPRPTVTLSGCPSPATPRPGALNGFHRGELEAQRNWQFREWTVPFGASLRVSRTDRMTNPADFAGGKLRWQGFPFCKRLIACDAMPQH
jgi:hypothetical protein